MKNQSFFSHVGRAVLLLCLVAAVNAVYAQPCGSKVSAEDAAFMKVHRTAMRSYSVGETRGIRDFPIQAHIVTKVNGSGGADIPTIKAAINTLNNYYVNANVRFVLLDEIKYIRNNEYYDLDTKEEDALCNPNDLKGVINMYFVGSLMMQGTELCGYAYFPNNQSSLMKKDRVIMQNTCVDDACTLPHEMGHYFALYHTHGKTNFGTTDELVSKANCGVAGDELCDTPADPMIFGKVDRDCRYIGKDKDKNGALYAPPTTNMMSYSNNNCLREFTKEQYARINHAAFNLRNYLQFPNKNTPAPIATNTPASNTPVKLSGEMELKIENQTVATRLDGNLYVGTKPYYSGTSYQVSVKNNDPAFVYVIGADLTAQITQLFPMSNQSAQMNARSRVLLPSPSERFTMDDTIGKDYLCVLYSRNELDINSVTTKMAASKGTFMQRLYMALGQQIVPANQIGYATNGRLAFSATAFGAQNVVPVIIELKHQ